MPGMPVKYAVTVNDPGDTAAIDPANLFVSVEYAEGFDKAASKMGHQQGTTAISGKSLVQTLDCKGCHKEAEKSIGPAFIDVSRKYLSNKDAFGYLTNKIAKGGAGVWGEVAMPAHPNLPQEDLHLIVSWVLSLSKTGTAQKSLPASGSIMPPAALKPNTVMVLSASYTDKGGNNIKALTGTNSTTFNSNILSFTGDEKRNGFESVSYNGMNMMMFPKAEGWFATPAIDLTSVGVINVNCGSQDGFKSPISFEARLDAPNGKLLGKGMVAVSGKPVAGKPQMGIAKIPVEQVSDGKMHNVYFVCNLTDKIQGAVMSVEFKLK